MKSLNLSAVKTSPGVVDVITIDDIPAERDIGPVFKGDPILAGPELMFHGQALFVVAADSFRQAKTAALAAEIDVDEADE